MTSVDCTPTAVVRNRGPAPQDPIKRFWSKVQKTDTCWLWTDCRIKRYGYGQFGVKVGGKWKMRRAHRVAWELTRGEIPPGLEVLHSCDVTACVNPEHLFLGTQADNMADMRRKGRGFAPPHPSGSDHYMAKRKAAALVAVTA